jgi:Mrp family chromosome partitioning ATPase
MQSVLRDLATTLELVSPRLGQHGVLGLTSSVDGEGKTTIACGLARVLAADNALIPNVHPGRTVLLLECNARTSGLEQELGVAPGPGLLDHLRAGCSLDETVRVTLLRGLYFMPVGADTTHFSGLIRSPGLQSAFSKLREQFDLIILDGPSALGSRDITILANLVDSMVLVVRAGLTASRLVRQAIEAFSPELLAGVVLNGSRADLPHWLESRL